MTTIKRSVDWRSPSICPIYKAAVLASGNGSALLAPEGGADRDRLELLISYDYYECSWLHSPVCCNATK